MSVLSRRSGWLNRKNSGLRPGERQARVRRAGLGVEGLESRQLLAASITINALNQLSFAGDAAADNVTIDFSGNTYTIADAGIAINITNNGSGVTTTGTGTSSVTITSLGSLGTSSLGFDGGTGNDTFNLLRNADPTSFNDGGATTDNVNIGASGHLTGILGTVSVRNLPGFTNLVVDGSADTSPEVIALGTGSLTGIAPATINFVGLDIQSLDIRAGSGGNQVQIQGTPVSGATTTFATGSGADAVAVLATAGPLNLNGVASRDTVIVGNAGSLSGIFGTVNVSNPVSLTNLTIDDSADAIPRLATASATSVTGLSIGDINYVPNDIDQFVLSLGGGGNTLTVSQTISSSPSTFNTGSGSDTVSIQQTAAGSTLALNTQGGTDTVILGNAGSVQGLLGPVTVTKTSGTTLLTIDDSADATARTIGLQASQVTGIAPSSVDISAASVSVLTVLAGSGGNTVDVSGTPLGAAIGLFTGTGGDTVNVTATSPSTLAIHGQGGNDQVLLGLSGSTSLITGNVSVDNTAGFTNLAFDDSADTSARSVFIANTSIAGLTTQPVTFSPADVAINIAGPSGDSLYTIGSTNAGAPVSLVGGSGNDRFVFLDGGTLNGGSVDGGSGENTLDYSAYTSSVNVNLATGVATGTGTVVNITTVIGGSAPDTIVAGDSGASLVGGAGADSLTGGAGDDTILGGIGNDSIDARGGDDLIIWNNGDGSDVVDGGAGFNTQVVNGSDASGDQFLITANGSRINFQRTNLGLFTLDLGTIQSLQVNGLGGGDTTTVDFLNGNPIPSGFFGQPGITFDGGTGNNTLVFQRTSGSFQATNETYTAFDSNSGNVSFDATTVGFTNLRPIVDSVPATNYTFIPPAAPSSVNVTSGSPIGAFGSTLIASGDTPVGFEQATIANKTNITINANTGPFSGDQTIVVNQAQPSTGEATLAILGGFGNDSLTITTAPAAVALSANMGSGNDVVNVNAANLSLLGTYFFDGGNGVDTLNVNAGGGALLSPPGVSPILIAGRPPIAYANFEFVNITGTPNTPPVVTVSPIVATAGLNLVNATVATFTDADPGDTASTFLATINWGDGTLSAGTITQDASTPSVFYVTGSHLYRAPGAFTVSVSVLDKGSTTTTVVGGTTITVTSGPLPAVTASGSAVVSYAAVTVSGFNLIGIEGAPLVTQVITPGGPVLVPSVVATFTSFNPYASVGTYTATIDWGDGTANSAGTITATGTSPNGVTFSVATSAAHVYAEEGAYPITVTITSTAGTAGIAHSTALINDASLTATGVDPNATAGTPLSNATVATFVDNGGPEETGEYTATINWGDGTAPTQGIVVPLLGGTGFAVQGAHTFPIAGTYAGTVTINAHGGAHAVVPIVTTVFGIVQTTAPITGTEEIPLSNVVLATLSSNGGPAILPSAYTATVDYGDGSPVTPAAITSTGDIVGSHTYQEGGIYTVLVTVGTTGNPNLLTFTRPITINDVPIVLNAHLDPNSDTGISNTDGITKITTPVFVGNSEPGSQVSVFATLSGGGPLIYLGSATTNESGSFTVVSPVSLADGSYTIRVHAIDENGATTADIQLANLVIDTVGPRVTNFQFDRPLGEVIATFQDDRSGLWQNRLYDNANYSITKPHTRAGALLFTSLTATPFNGPTGPQTVTGVINNNLKLRGGSYTVTIRSGGIEDIAGNALDGEFYGYVPSGNGTPGGNFVAIIDTVHAKIFSPKPENGFASPEMPPGALLPSYIIGPGTTVTPRGPRIHLHFGNGNGSATTNTTRVKQHAAKPVAHVSHVAAKPAAKPHAVPVIFHQAAAAPKSQTQNANDAALASMTRPGWLD